MSKQTLHKNWKSKLHEIIYEADTPAGKLFDVVLLIFILASIILVMLESVIAPDIKSLELLKQQDQEQYLNLLRYQNLLNIGEWIVTILFTLEYIARIISVKKPLKYITSFYGIIDLLSTIPKYLSLIFVGTHALVALRALRLLRVFRILKLARYLGASNNLVRALKASRVKISVFIFAVIILSIILGTIMYLVEGEENGFTNIPKSVYWCIVTLTTVGYGDIAPQTPIGQFIASLVMILGYGIIAVPTGIVTSEIAKTSDKQVPTNTQSCPNCSIEGHKDNAEFCYGCGHEMNG